MLITDIAQYLHDQGIGILGTDLFYSYLPAESPDSCMTVLDTGGTEPDPDIPTKTPTFQIFIRNTTYSGGKAKLDAIRSSLHQQANTDLGLGNTYFYYILAIAEGGHLGRNDIGLDEFSINFRCLTR